MKAIVHEQYGSPDVLELRDVDMPAVGDDGVLISVHAAGVNWADWAITRGMPYMVRLGYGVRRPRHGALGSDVAGVVEATGPEVTGLRPGDEVFGWCKGAFAEYAAGPQENFVAKPDNVTFEQVAGVPMAGCVALQAVRDVARIRPGQKVLVNGASGGIGTFTVQIAKSYGAEVTGVCSTPNVQLVHSLGADHVIDYTRDDFTRSGERYDLILDIADDRSLSERRRALTPAGTLIPNSGEGGRWFGSLGRILGARLLSMFVRQRLHPFLSMAKHHDLVELAGLIESGTVNPVVGRTYPLGATADAVRHVGERHTRGKCVITV